MFEDKNRFSYKIQKNWKRRNRQISHINRLDPHSVEHMEEHGVPEDVILEAGPKKQFSWNLYENPSMGWRPGITKKSLGIRKRENRRRERNRRRENRKRRIRMKNR